MAKQTIFGRIAQLTKANINALIDAAEDPEKMLDQMVRDYTNNIREAEAAVAQTIGNLRLLEKDHAEDVKAAQEWGTKALAASNKADEFRAAGDVANADKFDNLAKIALNKQLRRLHRLLSLSWLLRLRLSTSSRTVWRRCAPSLKRSSTSAMS